MKETTLFLRVCVYMTTRSWPNVWHTTFTKYTKESDLQYGSCLNIFICQLCGSIICLYFNCNYTQPVWEQISNTNQFIQNAQPTCGHAVWTYPLRVYSEILMIRMFTVSAMVTDHIRSLLCITTTHRRVKARCGVRLQIATRSGRQLPSTSPSETSLNHHYSRSHLLLKRNSYCDLSMSWSQCACGCTHS